MSRIFVVWLLSLHDRIAFMIRLSISLGSIVYLTNITLLLETATTRAARVPLNVLNAPDASVRAPKHEPSPGLPPT